MISIFPDSGLGGILSWRTKTTPNCEFSASRTHENKKCYLITCAAEAEAEDHRGAKTASAAIHASLKPNEYLSPRPSAAAAANQSSLWRSQLDTSAAPAPLRTPRGSGTEGRSERRVNDSVFYDMSDVPFSHSTPHTAQTRNRSNAGSDGHRDVLTKTVARSVD